MKSGWVTKKLGEVCELINGKNQSEVSDPNVGLILAGKANKSGRRCGKDSEWRKPIEEVGIKFGNDDYVINWKDAKIPV